MRRQHLPFCALVLALAVVGALAVGVPARSLAFGLLVLACPLMMLFMHGGHGGHSSHNTDDGHGEHQDSKAPPSSSGMVPPRVG